MSHLLSFSGESPTNYDSYSVGPRIACSVYSSVYRAMRTRDRYPTQAISKATYKIVAIKETAISYLLHKSNLINEIATMKQANHHNIINCLILSGRGEAARSGL